MSPLLGYFTVARKRREWAPASPKRRGKGSKKAATDAPVHSRDFRIKGPARQGSGF